MPARAGSTTRPSNRALRAALRIADATERARAFAQLDADFARAGAAVPFATDVNTDFFSDRIGCQVDQPIYGILLARFACVASGGYADRTTAAPAGLLAQAE
jgi:hypothetical protein